MSALCSDPRCLQSLTGSYELLLRVKDSGRQAGTCLPASLVVSLRGCQASKRPGLLACLLPAEQSAQTRMCLHNPEAPGVHTFPNRDTRSWQGSRTVAQCEI